MPTAPEQHEQHGQHGQHERHRRALSAAVAVVLGRVDAHAAGKPVPVKNTADPAAEGTSALAAVCSCFGLTPFERDVLVLTAATEIDPTTAARCAAAGGDPQRAYPTFSLALAALREPYWAALTPVAPLRRWRLVELDDPGSPTTTRLRIDERILHFLAGVPYLDSRLHGLVVPVEVPGPPPPSQVLLAERLAASWTDTEGDPRAELAGADRQTRREVAAAAAGACGLSLYRVDAVDLPAEPRERDALGRLWEREAVLLPAALLVEVDEGRERHAVVEAFAAPLGVPVVLSSADSLPVREHRNRFAVGALPVDEQQELWSEAVNGPAATNGSRRLGEGELKRLVAQFSLPAHVIRAAGETVRRETGEPAGLAWRAGLAESRMALDELGQRIEPRAGREDLVLAHRERAVLAEIIAHVRARATVYQDWGFESVLRRGLGVTALFAGGSGTGKTLAAEVVAGELGLDLFVIDLSQVVSKYIGETEKNLRRVFDAAERGGAVLLFDEADALFGKRSEVKDSHDRYANLEVSYLLMRMEAYRGLAILTTNLKKALDQAFLRRIRFVVDFPFPSAAERAEIWRRVIPGATPVDGVDPRRLAQLTVAGGSIRNIALSAAFLAADEGAVLGMRHLLAASRTEYQKLERSLTPGEVAGWV
ncbi:ATP-binding protein [Amycolatopsis nigrescens]|uniref:ATP-binding protein n=1 Tax=Amycolatopsis nigrescens TaxID=381445 RepID=UPI0003829CB4|nr:ATP-binding protein [Amycolatopsis nigrescens]